MTTNRLLSSDSHAVQIVGLASGVDEDFVSLTTWNFDRIALFFELAWTLPQICASLKDCLNFWRWLTFPRGTTFENLEVSHSPWWTKTLRHIMWSFMVARPRFARRLRTKTNLFCIGQPFHDPFLGSVPGCGVSVNPRHIREHGGAGPHYSEVAQVVFSDTSRNMCV